MSEPCFFPLLIIYEYKSLLAVAARLIEPAMVMAPEEATSEPDQDLGGSTGKDSEVVKAKPKSISVPFYAKQIPFKSLILNQFVLSHHANEKAIYQLSR